MKPVSLRSMTVLLFAMLAASAPVIRAADHTSGPAAAKAAFPAPSKQNPVTAASIKQQIQPAKGVNKGAKASAAPAASAHRYTTPAQRYLQPAISRLKPAGTLPADSGVSGTGVNFPGFLSASAFVRVSNAADANPTWASVTADVNNDGMPDIVNVQIDGTLSVLLNPGKGNLSSLAVSSVNTSAVSPNAQIVNATTADLNGDGYPDVLATDAGDNCIDVYLNNGNGTFANAVQYTVNFTGGYDLPALYGGSILVGDVNGDGALDMVVLAADTYYPDFSSSFIEQFTFLGKGDGTFAAPLPEQTATFGGALNLIAGQMQLADVNKDGKLDLVFLSGAFDNSYNEAVFLTVAPGDGKGGFSGLPTAIPATGAIVANESDGNVGGLYLGDVDGDGNLDALFADGHQNLYLSLGAGNGAFGTVTTPLTNLASAPVVNFADVNGDGNVDVIAYYNGSISVFLAQGKGAFSSTPQNIVSGAGGDQQPMPADFDGDGNVDLVDTDYGLSAVGVFLGNSGTFRGASVVVPNGINTQNFSVIAAGDLNGDGIPDVLATEYSSQYYQPMPDLIAGINDGKGNFTYTTGLSDDTLADDNISHVEPVIADLNGDGKGDLLLATEYGIAVAYGNGDGTFATPKNIPLGAIPECTPNYADVGDLNGDGKPDIVLAYPGDASCGLGAYGTTPSGVFSLLNNGDGTFTPSFTGIGNSAYEPKLIDFNGDGKLDIAVSDVNSTLYVYNLYTILGNGDGTFNMSTVNLPLSNYAVASIIPGDFDGDGKQDLTLGVVTAYDNSQQPVFNTTGIEMIKGNGDGTFGLPVQHAGGLVPLAGYYADFNGDGRQDLALDLVGTTLYPNIVSSSFAYMANLGGGEFTEPQQTFTGPVTFGSLEQNQFLGVADFNGDGAPDVINQPGLGSELFLNAGAIQLSLAADATATQGSPVTLTATLKPSVGIDAPTGTLSIYDNGTLIQTSSITGLTTSANLSTPAAGSHMLTATYSGDSHYNGASASASVNVTVTALPPSFTVSAPSPSSLSLAQGATGTVALTLAANATFSGAVQLTCSGAPTEASCTVTPGNATLAAGQTATVAVVVATTPPNGVYQARNHGSSGWKVLGGVSLAGFAVLLLPIRRRLPKAFLMIALFALALAGAGAMTGCGGDGGSKYPGTTVGTSTLTITATSGSITQTQTISLSVTKPSAQ